MENTKRNFKGHGPRHRFFHWAKAKMTGSDAFDIFYGEKGQEYPKEMKEEFVELFDRMKAMHEKLHGDRKAFMDKWKEYVSQDGDCREGGRFGEGHPFGAGMEGCRGEGFHGHGHGHGFFGR